MGDRLGEQDGYPPGVSNRDFAGTGDDMLDHCPECGGLWEPFVGCQDCGLEAELDVDDDDA